MDSIDIALFIGYALFGLAAGAAIIMPLVNAAGNPSVLVKSGIGIGVLVVVFIIGFVLADGDVTSLYERKEVGSSLSKTIGGALIACYVLFLGGVVGIAHTGLSKFFK